MDVAGRSVGRPYPQGGGQARREGQAQQDRPPGGAVDLVDHPVADQGRAQQEQPGDQQGPAAADHRHRHERGGQAGHGPARQPGRGQQHQHADDGVLGQDLARPQQHVPEADREQRQQPAQQDQPWAGGAAAAESSSSENPMPNSREKIGKHRSPTSSPRRPWAARRRRCCRRLSVGCWRAGSRTARTRAGRRARRSAAGRGRASRGLFWGDAGLHRARASSCGRGSGAGIGHKWYFAVRDRTFGQLGTILIVILSGGMVARSNQSGSGRGCDSQGAA